MSKTRQKKTDRQVKLSVNKKYTHKEEVVNAWKYRKIGT